MQRPPPGPNQRISGPMLGTPPGPGEGHLQDLRARPEEDERMWAMVAHVVGMFLPIIGPLAMWAIKRDDSEYIAYHCAQAFLWSTLTIVGSVVITVITCGAGSVVFPLFWLGSAYVALEAKEGSWTGYWVINSLGYDRKLL